MPEPHQLADFRRHAEWALAASAAHELGLIEALADGSATAGEVAARLELSPRGARILLGALEGLALVRREAAGREEGVEDRFHLTEAGRAVFVERGGPEFLGDAMRLWQQNVRRWAVELPEAARTGTSPREITAPGTGDTTDREGLARFMAAMDNKPPEQVEAVVEGCLARAPHARTMLDLGGGPGTFARAFARRGLRATLFDRPEVIDLVAERWALREIPGLELQRGDFLAAPPTGEFDVVLLANVTHVYDAATNEKLVRDLARLVRPGGVMAVFDFVRGVSEFAPLFAITMLLNTRQGDTYTLAEYGRWLEDAGLGEVRCTSVDPDRQLVTAVRAG